MQRGVADEALHRTANATSLGWIDENACLAHYFRDDRRVHRDHRRAVRHCLQQHKAEPLHQRGEDHCRAGSIELVELILCDEARQLDPAVADFGNQPLHARHGIPGAAGNPQLVSQLPQAVAVVELDNELLDVLASLDHADIQEEALTVRATAFPTLHWRSAFVDDRDTRARKASEQTDIAAREFRNRNRAIRLPQRRTNQAALQSAPKSTEFLGKPEMCEIMNCHDDGAAEPRRVY